MTRARTIPAKLVLFVVIAASPLLDGCGPKGDGVTVLPAKPRPYVADVPVPRDFELDRRKSTHDNKPGARVVRHIYVGTDRPQAANDFYKQLMPTFDWEFVDERLQNGAFILRYTKAGERCEVRVDEMPGGFWGPKTRVTVEIANKE